MNRTSFRRAIAPGLVALGLLLSACGGGNAADAAGGSGTVAVDGSSTVFPLSNAVYELMSLEGTEVKATIGQSGTGGGFEKFCAGQTDLSDASRPIEDEEAKACKAEGVEYTELQVATDALTIVVHPDLAVDCLTTDQLIELWSPDSTVDNWSDLDPGFPDEEISLFGPGADSGTYDYLASDVIGAESESTRTDYEASEDDTVLVQGVAGTPGGTGYFGYTYYEENADKLKAVAIDDGNGCVEPSAETAQAGEYTPLSRPLLVYVSNKAYADNPAVKGFVDFYIENLETAVEAAQFVPLNDDQLAETQAALAGLTG